MISSANLIAAMLLTALVIERAVSAGTFVTSLLWPERVLRTFGVENQQVADALLTWLVLLSGTDRLSAFIGSGADRALSSKGGQAALDLRGTVSVDGASARAVSDRVGS